MLLVVYNDLLQCFNVVSSAELRGYQDEAAMVKAIWKACKKPEMCNVVAGVTFEGISSKTKTLPEIIKYKIHKFAKLGTGTSFALSV